MSTVKTYCSSFFNRVQQREHIGVDDISDILVQIKNVPAKLTNMMSCSGCWNNDEIIAFLELCNNKQESLLSLWSIYIDMLQQNPSAITFETTCREQMNSQTAFMQIMQSELSSTTYFQLALFTQFKYLFYTECFHIAETDDIDEYDVNNITYKWNIPKSEEINTSRIRQTYEDELAIDEIIAIDTRQHHLLTFGFIRRLNIKNSQHMTCLVMHLCLEYSVFINWRTVPNEYDLINFVTAEDIKSADMYKASGNSYFQRKQYEDAIVKYDKALFHDNDNHLIYNNLALCYFKLRDYTNSKQGALTAIQNEPNFIKAWVRLAMTTICLQEYEIATVCLLTAYCIDVKFDEHKCKFQVMKASQLSDNPMLHKLYKHNEAIIQQKMDEEEQKALDNNVALFFDTDRYRDESQWFATVRDNIIACDPEMRQFHDAWIEQHGDDDFDAEYAQKFREHSFYLCDKQMRSLFLLYLSSRWNMTETINVFPMVRYCWKVSYSSLKGIKYNKRWFYFTVMEITRVYGEKIDETSRSICCKAVCGGPKASRLIKEISRLIAQREYKPTWIFAAWRARHEYEEMSMYFKSLGIKLMLENEFDAKRSANQFGNDCDGWNHRIF